MKIKVLGPIEIEDDAGRPVPLPSAPKCRQLLLLFLLNTNRPLPVEECIDELWAGRPPRSALSTLHTYVLQIRRALGTSGPGGTDGVVVTRNRGYLLEADCAHVDHIRFESIVEIGTRALRRGDDDGASASFAAALGLWRGPVGAGVRTGPRTAAERIRMHEVRLRVREQRIEAELRLGRSAEALPDLAELVAEHPYHENLTALYMIALSRSGRITEALHLYENVHDMMVAEFGMDPSGVLRSLRHDLAASSGPVSPTVR